MNTPRLGSAIALCALVVAWVPAAASIGGQKPVPPRGSAVGAYQREAVRRLLEGRVVAADSLRICVFRVSFTDRDMHPQHDSLYFANELRHLFEYYEGASRGRFELRWELMPGIIQLTGSEAYYGESDLWTERMSEILIQIVLERDGEVDFARYGAVAVIHAGAGRETDFNNDSPYQIYSGFVNPEEMAGALADTLGAPGVPTNDGAPGDTLYLDNLMIWPEEASQDGFAFGSLGIYAYQVGLRLGMVPLFDTTPEDYPDSQGCGNFDLMGYGIYNALGFVPSFPSRHHGRRHAAHRRYKHRCGGRHGARQDYDQSGGILSHRESGA
jgi:M6 family metalloprotease-like protein